MIMCIAFFRQLPSLVSLETLHMSNTERSPGNLPATLEPLTRLADVDLSHNCLAKVPHCLYTLRCVKSTRFACVLFGISFFIIIIIVIYHDFLPTARRDSHVKSDKTHTQSSRYTP